MHTNMESSTTHSHAHHHLRTRLSSKLRRHSKIQKDKHDSMHLIRSPTIHNPRKVVNYPTPSPPPGRSNSVSSPSTSTSPLSFDLRTRAIETFTALTSEDQSSSSSSWADGFISPSISFSHESPHFLHRTTSASSSSTSSSSNDEEDDDDDETHPQSPREAFLSFWSTRNASLPSEHKPEVLEALVDEEQRKVWIRSELPFSETDHSARRRRKESVDMLVFDIDGVLIGCEDEIRVVRGDGVE